ncbi:MAG: two component, sigma54 specific, transcriptional regulator, Fis family protein, partial [Phycisphaerales bacterium]|nr:two component, sigma54 specific, transcriptional regulator, Fis family protein [Phycisphaerales bacterium]
MTAPAKPSDSGRERVLLVDDTPANLDLLSRTLEPMGYDLAVATSGEAAVRVAMKSKPDLILLDVVMPGLDGLETCRRLKAEPTTRDIPIIFISARSQTASLLNGFHAGGVDYIAKPFDQDEVRTRVETHLKIARLTRALRDRNDELESTIAQLRQESGRRQKAEQDLETAGERLSLLSAREAEHWGLAAFVGRSPTLAKILTDVRRLQNFTRVNVLVHGESGTGKELVARALHFGSSRLAGPFIPVNCVAIPAELAESMLFGHLRGAFTGATMDRKGYFEL